MDPRTISAMGDFIDRHGVSTAVVVVLCVFVWFLLRQNASTIERLFTLYADQHEASKANIEATRANTASNDRLSSKIDKLAGCEASKFLGIKGPIQERA